MILARRSVHAPDPSDKVGKPQKDGVTRTGKLDPRTVFESPPPENLKQSPKPVETGLGGVAEGGI